MSTAIDNCSITEFCAPRRRRSVNFPKAISVGPSQFARGPPQLQIGQIISVFSHKKINNDQSLF
jgi:hypothetical protein